MSQCHDDYETPGVAATTEVAEVSPDPGRADQCHDVYEQPGEVGTAKVS